MQDAVYVTKSTPVARILVVDDDEQVARLHARLLTRPGYQVVVAKDGEEALDRLREQPVDVILADVNMPRMNGIQLLRAVRALDLDVVVLFVTGDPSVEAASQAIEYGALRYLLKPVEPELLVKSVADAVHLRKLAEEKRRTFAILEGSWRQLGDRASLEQRFHRGIDAMSMAYQPMMAARNCAVAGYEALIRTEEPTIPSPAAFFDAAERLGAVHSLGRAVRDSVAKVVANAPGDLLFFVNLHPLDFEDASLYQSTAPLSAVAGRVVLEVTERQTLAGLHDLPRCVARLRQLGYRLAIDDLGAGYAGLSGFALLEPDIVKLDSSLIRGLDESVVKRRIVRSMTTLCTDLGLEVVAEGIETPAERDAVLSLGCHYLQGYLFAWPGPAFPTATW